ncbi:helix-turn-helix domain-containing protein [Streptomyces sp. RFCAC02]|uniref:RICIN domain-containing protein n=1 Tax=Streptomyces sp. RFCAC02 TaxID=2499143 RepID=UPI00102023D7|nr:helix-turn-helix domain-containing protein [Streptomyces sp. RFCAC02]
MALDGPVFSPAAAQNVGELVAAMRTVKERSGLSLRQLGERAEARGDVLARSTLADVLNRSTLPRADMLAAFVRACGGGESDVREWLAVRERIAAAPEPGAAPAVRRRRPLVLGAVGAGLAVLVAAGAWVVLRDGGTPAEAAVPDGEVEIRSADEPGLCLSEGVERSGRYGNPVAVQEPCSPQAEPRTFLRAVGEDDLYFLEWDHPVEGRGCLTFVSDGPAAGLLEPVNDEHCAADRPEQHFRLEPVSGRGGGDAPAYLLRNAGTDECIGFPDDGAADGAEAIQRPCDGDAAQAFVIGAAR